MAADRDIMKAIRDSERDAAVEVASAVTLDVTFKTWAANLHHRADLWDRSGAKGRQGNAAELRTVAGHADRLAEALAKLPAEVAEIRAAMLTEEASIDAEITASAERIIGMTRIESLDALVADARAEGRGEVRVPDVDADPTIAAVQQRSADVEAYLRGDVDDLPDSQPLQPSSVHDATASRPLAEGETIEIGGTDVTEYVQTTTLPTTWESDSMTADGLRKPGQDNTPTAPLLGQPGDMGPGYDPGYIPPGGRTVTFAELLTPVPRASLPQHLSHSQIGTVGDCAAKYRLGRVEGLPQIPQWANVGGNAFHVAVEALERTVLKMREANPATPSHIDFAAYDTATAWRHHFQSQIDAVAATSPVPQSMWRSSDRGRRNETWWWENGPLMLRRYLDARPDEPTANQNATFESMIEYEVAADVPTPYGPLSYKAVIDRVTVRQPEPGGNFVTLVIRDYKTGAGQPDSIEQLAEYAWMLRLNGTPESVKIMGTFFDANKGTWSAPVDLLEAWPFEAFAYRVAAGHAQKLALTSGPTPVRPSSFCGGCDVRYACPIKGAKGVG
jgi:hypothetical protein